MSGVVKAIGKVFKAVVKVVKKIAPIVLAAGAILFTAGAALPSLGLTSIFGVSTAGGFGGAIGGLVAHVGLTGTIGNIVAGAVTYAGFGAAAGGLVSAITGKNVMKGMAQGALVGGIAGGAMGALGISTLASTAAAASPTAAAGAGIPGVGTTGGAAGIPAVTGAPVPAMGAQGSAVGGAASGAAMSAPLGGTAAGVSAVSAPLTAAAAGSPALTAGSTGFFSNPIVAGGLIGGVGQGLGNFAAAKATGEQQQAERDATSANYGTPAGGSTQPAITMGSAQMTAGAGNPTPAARFDPLDPGNQPGHYVVDPESGQVVFVRNAANLVANPQAMGTKV